MTFSHSRTKARAQGPPILAVCTGTNYLRAPRCGFFRLVWRRLALVRLGLLIMNVPLPRYSALYVLSSANGISLKGDVVYCSAVGPAKVSPARAGCATWQHAMALEAAAAIWYVVAEQVTPMRGMGRSRTVAGRSIGGSADWRVGRFGGSADRRVGRLAARPIGGSVDWRLGRLAGRPIGDAPRRSRLSHVAHPPAPGITYSVARSKNR